MIWQGQKYAKRSHIVNITLKLVETQDICIMSPLKMNPTIIKIR